jgi:hypothetical protein
MGLDMYLEKRVYVGTYDRATGETGSSITSTDSRVNAKRVEYVVEGVAYWRKANAIHAWFVRECAKGVDDCKPVWVPEEKLFQLLDLVRTVLAEPKRGPELLPTQSGFFFGDTAYDDSYRDDLKLTEEMLERVLKEEGAGNIYYRASW